MGSLDDFAGYDRALQNELERLDQHHDEDIPLIKRFIRRVDGDLEPGSLKLYLGQLRRTSKRIGKPLHMLTGPEFEEHIYDLRHADEYGFSDSTIQLIEFSVRRFFSVLDLETDGWHEDYELSSVNTKTVTPDDMLSAEDIAVLRDGANNMRDIALIEFFADTGARRTMAGSLRVGDVDVESEEATYRPNPNALGLKGAEIMRYPIIDARATIRQYLNTTHPRPNRDDVALFHAIPGHGNDIEGTDGAISPTTMGVQLRRAAKGGGVDKPVNPHNFRHSAVTRMAREGYTRSQIEHRVHWNIDTDMWETYQHIAGEQHNEDIFRAAGILEEEGSEFTQQRHPCGNCHESLAPHHEYCPRCGDSASPEARDRKRQAISSIAKALHQMNDDERSEFLAESVEELEADPSLMGSHESPSSK